MRWSTVIWITLIALLIIPAAISLIFIKEYGVNVVYWDQWEIVPLFDKLFTGHLSFTDLFAQHNEHRIFFPRLVMLFLGNLTQYNNLEEMYFSWFLLCITVIILLKFYTRYFGTTQVSIAKFIPATWLIFSLRQWENLLWGFQVTWFMVILFSVLSLYLLSTGTRPGWRLWLAIISAVVCSFSSAQGLLVWPIGLIQILLTMWPQRKEFKRLYIKILSVWCLTGILAYIAYFVGYAKPPYHPDLFYFLSNPFSAITYLLVATGSPLAINITSATALGIVVLALYIFTTTYLISRKLMNSPYVPFFVSLILFALFTTVILMISRAGFGPDQALASRYTSLIMLGIIGLYLMIISIELTGKIKPFLSGFIIALIALGIITTYSHAIVFDGKNIKDSRTLAAEYLSNVEIPNDDNLKTLYPNPKVVRDRVMILRKYHLNVFSPNSYTSPP